jgi:chloramphenicol 3-O-phosphotransferase
MLVSVEAATKTGAARNARKKMREKGYFKGWYFVDAKPVVKHPDKKLYIWDVSYRRKK